MESWNYGYGDIGESFGGNRGTVLRAAVVTAAKTLKLDDIAHAEQRIYFAGTHTYAYVHAICWCFRFYYSILLYNSLSEAILVTAQIWLEKNDFSSFSCRV